MIRNSLQMLLVGLALFFVFGCSSQKTGSFHYTQKQIEKGDLDFDTRLRVDEYVNAFPQDDLAKPSPGEDVSVRIDWLSNVALKGSATTLAQVAVRSREANATEKSKRFGISMVLDISGSMASEEKFTHAIEGLLAMVAELSEGTEFSLVTFSTEARVDIPTTVIDRKTREVVRQRIREISIEGGTNIEAGLTLGYKTMAQFSRGTVSRLLLVTDGQSNVGITDPKEIAKKAGVQYLEGARISTIGLGHDVDENLLRKIAEKGQGAYYFAESGTALKNLFRKDVQSLVIPIAKSVKIKIVVGPEAILKKVYGYNQPIENNTMTIEAGELNSDDWRIFMVEIEGKDKPIVLEANASFVHMNGKTPVNRKDTKTLAIDPKQKPKLNKVVARNAIIFANALALIEVSKLAKEKKYTEAEDVLSVQLVSLEFGRSIDSSPELTTEFENLRKVGQLLRDRKNPNDSPSPTTSVRAVPAMGPTESKIAKAALKGSLVLAQKAVPGPWGVVLMLIGLAIEIE